MTAAATPILAAIAAWLAATPLSNLLGRLEWTIPVIQSVHILAVALTLAAIAIINLRVLGLVERGQPMDQVFARRLPWAAWAFPVLLATGLLLITAEPTRAPFRVVFWLKMALIAGAAAITWGLRPALAGRQMAPTGAKIAAVLALLLWASVAVAGRWIGYSNGWAGSPQ